MGGIVLVLIAWPIVELIVMVAVAHAIGVVLMLLLLLAGSAAGEMVLRRGGRRTGQRVGEAWRAGGGTQTDRTQTELTDGALLMLGGLLLLIPGFVSDAVGLLLVLPFTRPLARRLVVRRIPRVVVRTAQMRTRGTAYGDDVIEGEVVGESQPPGSQAGPPDAIDRGPRGGP